MKTLKRRSLTFTTIIALMFGGVFISCQEESKTEEAMDKAKLEMRKFAERIEDLTEDDPEYIDKLEMRIIEFDAAMNELGEDLEYTGDKAEKLFYQKVDKVRNDVNGLKTKLGNWKSKKSDDIEGFRNEIKNDLNSLREEINDLKE